MVALLLPCAGLASLTLLQARALRRTRREQQDVRVRQAGLVRGARLTAAELRNISLGLLGHAESMDEPARHFLLHTEAALLDMAETLLRHTEAPGAERRLEDEEIALYGAVDYAVRHVSALLGPGRRAWRVADGLRGIVLLADRRALHQILLRILAAAAFGSTDGDWIAIWGVAGPEGWSLIVEDEGAGLTLSRGGGADVDSRGIGVGLTLARALMQAHGGTLSLDSTAGVGTRARLLFPSIRLLSGC